MTMELKKYWLVGHTETLHAKPTCGANRRGRLLRPRPVEITEAEAILKWRFCQKCNPIERRARQIARLVPAGAELVSAPKN